MPTADAEIDRNFDAFADEWWRQLNHAKTSLDSNRPRFAVSYRRLVSLNAWRDPLLESSASEGALAFFIEGQNDAVLSHVQAGLGSWRLALKCLRGFLENALSFIYFREHPVELRQWVAGEYRPTARELFDYCGTHPDVRGPPEDLTGLPALRQEYATLSRAVHASSAGFRMTAGVPLPSLTLPDRARFGMWLTRERQVIMGVNLLLLTLFRERLAGAAYPHLRVSVGHVVPAGLHARILSDLGVRLIRS